MYLELKSSNLSPYYTVLQLRVISLTAGYFSFSKILTKSTSLLFSVLCCYNSETSWFIYLFQVGSPEGLLPDSYGFRGHSQDSHLYTLWDVRVSPAFFWPEERQEHYPEDDGSDLR